MIYLDHNASTPVRPEVIAAMHSALEDLHANPSSAHREGQRARAAVERAREQVASLVAARPDEVVFVSGGTEGDHVGLIGLAWANESRGRAIALSSVEHHAVHGAGDVLARLGFRIVHLPVGTRGYVEPDAIDALPDDVAVVAVMLANNETGVLQPVAEITRRAHARGMRVHCDAVQAAGKVPIDSAALETDTLVLSAHKFGGPKGAAAMILRSGVPFEPLFRGTAHEGGRRGGTENLSGIVGLGVAAEMAARDLDAESPRLRELRQRLERGIVAEFPDAVVHGAGAPRLPNTTNLSIPGARSDHMLMRLDSLGVEISAGAACASGAVEPSPVLSAMGVPRDLAVCAMRLSLGRTTTAEEVDWAIAAVIESAKLVRSLAGAPAQA